MHCVTSGDAGTDLAGPPASGAVPPRVESVWKLADRLATDRRGIVRGGVAAIDCGEVTAIDIGEVATIDIGEVATIGDAGNIITKLASRDVPYRYEVVSEIGYSL